MPSAVASATDLSEFDERTPATTSIRSSNRAAVRWTGPMSAAPPPPITPRRTRRPSACNAGLRSIRPSWFIHRSGLRCHRPSQPARPPCARLRALEGGQGRPVYLDDDPTIEVWPERGHKLLERQIALSGLRPKPCQNGLRIGPPRGKRFIARFDLDVLHVEHRDPVPEITEERHHIGPRPSEVASVGAEAQNVAAHRAEHMARLVIGLDPGSDVGMERGGDTLAFQDFDRPPDLVGDEVEPAALGPRSDRRLLQSDRVKRGHADSDENVSLPEGGLLPCRFSGVLEGLTERHVLLRARHGEIARRGNETGPIEAAAVLCDFQRCRRRRHRAETGTLDETEHLVELRTFGAVVVTVGGREPLDRVQRPFIAVF